MESEGRAGQEGASGPVVWWKHEARPLVPRGKLVRAERQLTGLGAQCEVVAPPPSSGQAC